jgi:hypothetical protein
MLVTPRIAQDGAWGQADELRRFVCPKRKRETLAMRMFVGPHSAEFDALHGVCV